MHALQIISPLAQSIRFAEFGVLADAIPEGMARFEAAIAAAIAIAAMSNRLSARLPFLERVEPPPSRINGA